MICTRSRKRRTSTPMTAAGTIPKLESAEYRPPIPGTPENTLSNILRFGNPLQIGARVRNDDEVLRRLALADDLAERDRRSSP